MKGFTLIELMIVVAIIAALSSLASAKFQVFQVKARQVEAQSSLSQILPIAAAIPFRTRKLRIGRRLHRVVWLQLFPRWHYPVSQYWRL